MKLAISQNSHMLLKRLHVGIEPVLHSLLVNVLYGTQLVVDFALYAAKSTSSGGGGGGGVLICLR